MSGICGVVLRDKDSRLNPTHISSMVRALDVSKQGKDLTVSLGPVGVGARSFPGHITGVTEMTVHGHPLALAFHGSLYNFKELFSSAEPDTDPFLGILHLYVKEGMVFLQRLRGEFALALWDGREESFYLATDRFRVHPLFYYQDADKLIFASRIKGILACPLSVRRTVNPEAIVDVMASSIVPTPKTIFREVNKLPPGYFLTYRKGEIKVTPYWDISFLSNGAGDAELVRKLKAHFAEAISVRLEEDGIPDKIGTFLSGGVDSSVVTGMLALLSQHSIKSFSIGFDEQRFNEIEYARIAARAFGAEHYEYFVTPQDVNDAIPILLEAFDEPFANASAIPTYFCAKIAREHSVRILYAGDGGDELFAGNERYAMQRLFDYYYRIPSWFREPVLKPLMFILADKLGGGLFIKAKKYIQRASVPYPERLSSYGIFEIIPMRDLLENDLLEGVGRDYNTQIPLFSYYSQAPAQSELDRQLYIDLKLAISDNDLFKVTCMTEAAGIAVRFPFLDHRLAEFAATVPADLKMHGRQLRSFFKKAYADFLPLETRTKKKHGFGLPIPVWLRTDQRLREMMHDLLLSPRSVQRGYFQKKTLESLVDLHKHDETSFYGTVIWNLMIIELWHRHVQDSLV